MPTAKRRDFPYPRPESAFKWLIPCVIEFCESLVTPKAETFERANSLTIWLAQSGQTRRRVNRKKPPQTVCIAGLNVVVIGQCHEFFAGAKPAAGWCRRPLERKNRPDLHGGAGNRSGLQ